MSEHTSEQKSLRFATFNVAMSADKSGEVFSQLKEETSRRFTSIAAIIQNTQPDVLLLCEFDHLGHGGDDGMLAFFQKEYLEKPQLGQSAIHFPHTYLSATNTGLPVVEGDDISLSPERAHGFARHHGQYGFVILSKYPLDIENSRSWQTLPWQDFPGSRMPESYFQAKGLQSIRLSSKNHIALPVLVGDQRIHLVACHPTPPVFDGPERRNLRRNADELRLLHDIVTNAAFLVDDKGKGGGLDNRDAFVIMGDLNADPANGDGDRAQIRTLLSDPILHDVQPHSAGASSCISDSRMRGKSRATHNRGLRLDYVLPSHHLKPVDSGVFWPKVNDALASFIYNESGKPVSGRSSDHRLVWVDVILQGASQE
ncbi:Endonuclease/Exonuclease/phosphatase family protein [Grimontia celer]|uniref:Endonuclease/Exonuclease/phosphatase family protein n=1 Tax=Grimontia celer TaxID=1796497 RepID=A0A128EVK5_9GAMM|nr:endonuclease/exonuclease/phosphatase family protein [Grimontia celer]CZF78220.1 Endonuclease/Exonuclease/phosphatase family protein [Grimontia celer]